MLFYLWLCVAFSALHFRKKNAEREGEEIKLIEERSSYETGEERV